MGEVINGDYGYLLSSRSRRQWEKIGLKRRAGVATPLFSLYSRQSVGIGEIPDLKLLVDWCRKTGMSIIQLLPMNDVGFTFRPYDAPSSFAIEPVYLSIAEAAKEAESGFKKDIEVLCQKFPAGKKRVDYRLKAEKLGLLKRIFEETVKTPSSGLKQFIKENKFWLDDYALFKVIKSQNRESSWESWKVPLRERDQAALKDFAADNQKDILFQQWLQWSIFKQFSEVKKYAENNGVLIMGDLPFLVSRDSADVWANKDYFRLDLAAGAPPDMYFANGQRWGMPVYNWDNISANNYDYLIEKLRYAENFYSFFRIDHAVGTFRIWTVAADSPLEEGALNGRFEPSDEGVWEEHGRRIISAMVDNSTLLACAEDLGVVPECSYRVLHEFGIPGMEVQRWVKDWGNSYDFRDPSTYRKGALSTISTHDTTPFALWWSSDAGTIDERLFLRKCKEKGISYDEVKNILFDLEKSGHGRLRWADNVTHSGILSEVLRKPEHEMWDIVDMYKASYGEREKFWRYAQLHGPVEEKPSQKLVRSALEKVCATASIFCVNLLQDWLSLDGRLQWSSWDMRINMPGIMSDDNWSMVLPLSLEEMQKSPVCSIIKDINAKTSRA